MTAMRDELHYLVDRLPEVKLRPALELIRGQLGEAEDFRRDLPFFGSFVASDDLAERHEEIIRQELGH